MTNDKATETPIHRAKQANTCPTITAKSYTELKASNDALLEALKGIVNAFAFNAHLVKPEDLQSDVRRALEAINQPPSKQGGGVMKYGDKRDYRKIDIFVNGAYECSTNWAKTLKEAVSHYVDEHKHALFMSKAQSVKARFSNSLMENQGKAYSEGFSFSNATKQPPKGQRSLTRENNFDRRA